MALRSINPATLEVMFEGRELTDKELVAKIEKAHGAFTQWREVSYADRAKLMKRAAEQLRAGADRYAEIMSKEVGKTLAAAKAEVEKSAWACEFYADNAESFLRPVSVKTDASESFVRHDPIGVVLAVMPWNFPFWQVFRFAAPALMAGNAGILKHASNVQLSAQAIEEIFLAAGFPEGIFTNLAIGSGKVERVVRHPLVRAAALTGSEYAGSQVAKVAGEEIKKTVLELGGSDPFIVRADADLAAAAAAAVSGRMQANAGQSCIAAKRFIVHESVAKDFTRRVKVMMEKLVVGDPLDAATDIGPLASEQMVLDITRQVEESVQKGAALVTGGPSGKNGYYYPPTVLTGVKPGMPVYEEEIFGPVLPIIAYQADDEAVDIANSSPYGLGATIFSADLTAAKQLAARIDSGSVFINHQVKSDPRLPFGGVKKSGYGRELSHHGIMEFVNIKTVWIK